MFYSRRIIVLLGVAGSLLSMAFPQSAVQTRSMTSGYGHPIVTAVATANQTRFIALGISQRMRLQVQSPSGEVLYDSDFLPGNRINLDLNDPKASMLGDGRYDCIVIVEDFNGQISRRRGVFWIVNRTVLFDATNRNATAADSDAWEDLTILRAEEPHPFTFVSHDGKEGWIESASGGLNLYTGGLDRQRDSVPHLRLTPEGNVGIGVAEPQVKLDVAGLIRASEGIQFSDGTILKMEGGLPVLVTERPDDIIGASSGSSGKSIGKTTRGLTGGGTVQQFVTKTPDRVAASEGGSPYYNTLYGSSAGDALTTGGNNSFFGALAGSSNTSGTANSFFGFLTGNRNIASYNSFFGYRAGGDNTTGSSNAFFGDQSGYLNTTGYASSFFGHCAGFYNTTGRGNTFIGNYAGYTHTADKNTVENYNTLVGAYTLGAVGVTNATAIGYQAKVTQSNSLVLGSIAGVNDASADTKVGIGTTAPSQLLEVRKDQNASTYLQVTNLNNTRDVTRARFALVGGTVTQEMQSIAGDGGYFGTTSNHPFRIYTNRNTQVTIDAIGNVGIGTPNPKAKLQTDGGAIYVGSPGEGIILKSPNGLTCVKLTITNSGTPLFTPLACP